MTLGEYIKSASAKQFDWGAHDCSTFCADWRVARGHADPMADIRGLYHDEASAEGVIYDGGGLLRLWTERMPEPDKNPIAGAIAVVKLGRQELMALYSGERWIFLMDSGIRAVNLPISKILRVWNG